MCGMPKYNLDVARKFVLRNACDSLYTNIYKHCINGRYSYIEWKNAFILQWPKHAFLWQKWGKNNAFTLSLNSAQNYTASMTTVIFLSFSSHDATATTLLSLCTRFFMRIYFIKCEKYINTHSVASSDWCNHAPLHALPLGDFSIIYIYHHTLSYI